MNFITILQGRLALGLRSDCTKPDCIQVVNKTETTYGSDAAQNVCSVVARLQIRPASIENLHASSKPIRQR